VQPDPRDNPHPNRARHSAIHLVRKSPVTLIFRRGHSAENKSKPFIFFYRWLKKSPPTAGLDSLRHWRSLSHVHFIETQVFTRQITTLLDDGDYRQLQVTLALKPRAGDIIRGSGGLRKIRWARRGRGKSGGIRVIYYLVADEEIYFLFAYAKNKQEDLDSSQLRILRNLVKEEFK